ncbi:proteoglycan 3-like [Mixophyes fleayi]|uniref:proteoglycan 3-like n=1 Tax=Mixophyes fleayi TaxID=3061075 RepID=UPI003F4E0A5C
MEDWAQNDFDFTETTDQCDLEETADPDCQEDGSDLTDDLLTSDLSLCHNATVEKGTGHTDICPDKGTCSFHVFSIRRFFGRAQKICRRHRGTLSSIHSCNANNQVRCLAKRACVNQNLVWIGVRKHRRNCNYINVDRSRLNYTNWACGQRKRCGKWCTALNLSTGKWVSRRCRARLPFVCTY